MKRDEALRILTEISPTVIERFGVKGMRLFGSTARNEAREDSDVDVLVEFDGPATFRGFFGLLNYLEERVGKPVDLVTEKGLRKEVREYVEKDAIRVA